MIYREENFVLSKIFEWYKSSAADSVWGVLRIHPVRFVIEKDPNTDFNTTSSYAQLSYCSNSLDFFWFQNGLIEIFQITRARNEQPRADSLSAMSTPADSSPDPDAPALLQRIHRSLIRLTSWRTNVVLIFADWSTSQRMSPLFSNSVIFAVELTPFNSPSFFRWLFLSSFHIKSWQHGVHFVIYSSSFFIKLE